MRSGSPHVVLVGGVGGTNVAAGYAAACASLGVSHHLIEYATLLRWPLLWRAVRRFRGSARVPWFASSVPDRILGAGRHDAANILLVCGLSRLPAAVVAAVHDHGWQTGIYLTDSPWNTSLPYLVGPDHVLAYQRIFAPRRSDIARLGPAVNGRCTYLPFSYDPDQFHPEETAPSATGPDVLFVGGGDVERLPMIRAMLDLPVSTQIIGNYWPSLLDGHPAAIGQQPHTVVRAATVNARVNVCLVRRANGDGHVMRTVEIGACGGCMLAERTGEHLAILGPEGDAAMYFSDEAELAAKIRFLLAHPDRRRAMGRALLARIADRYRYTDSLRTVLSAFDADADTVLTTS